MSIVDELFDYECDNCDQHGSTVRITGGDLGGSHLSSYACILCATSKYNLIKSEYPDDTEMVELPKRD